MALLGSFTRYFTQSRGEPKTEVINRGAHSSVHFSGLDRLARNLFAGGVGRSREILDNSLNSLEDSWNGEEG